MVYSFNNNRSLLGIVLSQIFMTAMSDYVKKISNHYLNLLTCDPKQMAQVTGEIEICLS